MSEMNEAMARLAVMESMQGFERDRRRIMDLVEQWRNNERAEAWEEGHEAAAMRVPEGVWHDVAAPRPANPYRQEKDA